MAITDTALRNIKPASRPFKVSDSGGLHLLVSPTGGRHWKMAYRHAGKQKTLSFGPYPTVTLLEARKRRDEAKTVLAAGNDPAVTKREAEQAGFTFEAVAREWHDNQKNGWVQAHADRILSRLEADLFPTLGERTLESIEATHLLEALRKVEERGALEIAKRLRQYCGQVFRYGIATSRVKRDPTYDLRGALKRQPKVQHFASLKEDQISDFLTRLDAYDGHPITRLAITLTLLTFLRSNEIRFAEWSEFEKLDSDEPLWRIPAERMKNGKEHLVPLSKQAVAALAQIGQFSGSSQYLFPGNGKSSTMSYNTMLYGIYRMGYHSRLTMHGLRGTASTILNENDFNRDHIEKQLAHSERDEVRSAYNSAQWIGPRRQMMQWWADFIDRQRR